MAASGLGTLLVQEGLLSHHDHMTIKNASGDCAAAYAKGIIALGLLDEEELASAIAEFSAFRRADKNILDQADPDAFMHIDAALMSKLEVLPLSLKGNVLTVATMDPLDRATMHQLEFFTGFKLKPIIATYTQIRDSLRGLINHFEPAKSKLENFLENHINAAAFRQQVLDKKAAPHAAPTLKSVPKARRDDADVQVFNPPQVDLADGLEEENPAISSDSSMGDLGVDLSAPADPNDKPLDVSGLPGIDGDMEALQEEASSSVAAKPEATSVAFGESTEASAVEPADEVPAVELSENDVLTENLELDSPPAVAGENSSESQASPELEEADLNLDQVLAPAEADSPAVTTDEISAELDSPEVNSETPLEIPDADATSLGDTSEPAAVEVDADSIIEDVKAANTEAANSELDLGLQDLTNDIDQPVSESPTEPVSETPDISPIAGEEAPALDLAKLNQGMLNLMLSASGEPSLKVFADSVAEIFSQTGIWEILDKQPPTCVAHWASSDLEKLHLADSTDNKTLEKLLGQLPQKDVWVKVADLSLNNWPTDGGQLYAVKMQTGDGQRQWLLVCASKLALAKQNFVFASAAELFKSLLPKLR